MCCLLPEHIDIRKIHSTLHALNSVLSQIQLQSRFMKPFSMSLRKVDSLVSGRHESPPHEKPVDTDLQPETDETVIHEETQATQFQDR